MVARAEKKPAQPPEISLSAFPELERTIELVTRAINISYGGKKIMLPPLRSRDVKVVDQEWLTNYAEWQQISSLHPAARQIYGRFIKTLNIEARFAPTSFFYSPPRERRTFLGFLGKEPLERVQGVVSRPSFLLPLGLTFCHEQWRKAAPIHVSREVALAFFALGRYYEHLIEIAGDCKKLYPDLSDDKILEEADRVKDSFNQYLTNNWKEIRLAITGAKLEVLHQDKSLFFVGYQTNENVISLLSKPLMRRFLLEGASYFGMRDFDPDTYLAQKIAILEKENHLSLTSGCLERAGIKEHELLVAYINGQIPKKFAKKFAASPHLYI